MICDPRSVKTVCAAKKQIPLSNCACNSSEISRARPFAISVLPPGDHANDLQAVAGPNLAGGEFRRRDGFPVVLDHDAAGREVLRREEFPQGTGQRPGHRAAVGDDLRWFHNQAVSAASQSFHTGS